MLKTSTEWDNNETNNGMNYVYGLCIVTKRVQNDFESSVNLYIQSCICVIENKNIIEFENSNKMYISFLIMVYKSCGEATNILTLFYENRKRKFFKKVSLLTEKCLNTSLFMAFYLFN